MVAAPARQAVRTLVDKGVLRLLERTRAGHVGRCFYCLTQLTPRTLCLDHVIPLARLGRNSYRNLASCCVGCNTQKGETAADDFLRTLCRVRRLTAAELAGRLRALDALAAGDLRPVLPAPRLQFAVGAPKPTPPSYKRFPFGPCPTAAKPGRHPKGIDWALTRLLTSLRR